MKADTLEPPDAQAYISGQAGRAYIVRAGEVTTLRAGTSQIVDATPAQLHNFVFLSPDILTRPTAAPYDDVRSELDFRARCARCVTFVTVAVDRESDATERSIALSAANRLMRDRAVDNFVSDVFLSAEPTEEADFESCAQPTVMGPVALLCREVISRTPDIRRVWRAWDNMVAALPDPQLRVAANVFADAEQVVGKMVRAASFDVLTRTLLPTVASVADATLRSEITRWVADTGGFANAADPPLDRTTTQTLCSDVRRVVYFFLDGSLSHDRSVTLTNHLKTCPECEQRVSIHRKLRAFLAKRLGMSAAPESLKARLTKSFVALVDHVTASVPDRPSRDRKRPGK